MVSRQAGAAAGRWSGPAAGVAAADRKARMTRPSVTTVALAAAVAALAVAAPSRGQDAMPPDHGMYVLPGPTTTTDAQRAYAERLLRRAKRFGARWATRRLARADGYHPLSSRPDSQKTIFHYDNDARMHDGHQLDPRHPESLVYWRRGPGDFVLVALMFRLPLGSNLPHPAGALMPWHLHYRCVMPDDRSAGPMTGPCTDGMRMKTGPTVMAHVWFVDDLEHAFDPMHPPTDLLLPTPVH